MLFLTLLRVFPEPRAVYRPQGAQLARTVDVPIPAITGPGAEKDGSRTDGSAASSRHRGPLMDSWIDLSVPVVTGMPVYPGDPGSR